MKSEPYQDLFREHAEHTASYARELGEIVIVHDTNELELGQWYDYDTQKTSSALDFTAHFSLALKGALEPEAFGLLGLEEVSLDKKATAKRGSSKKAKPTVVEPPASRWVQAVSRCETLLGRSVRAVHVMDCEADSYAVYAGLLEAKARFVVRATERRSQADLRDTKLAELAGSVPIEVELEVPLSRRKGSTSAPKSERDHRDVRSAKLVVAPCSVALKRPRNFSDPMPVELRLCALRVTEAAPPPGQPGVNWVLLTNQPIETPDHMARVLASYQCRPQIEDFFRALKLGCLPEYKSLEERDVLLAALVACLSVACQLLQLRSRSRSTPEAPAEQVVRAQQVALLRRVGPRKLPGQPTIQQFVWALAGLGGHVAGNGAPGWNVIGRAWHKLISIELGMRPHELLRAAR